MVECIKRGSIDRPSKESRMLPATICQDSSESQNIDHPAAHGFLCGPQPESKFLARTGMGDGFLFENLALRVAHAHRVLAVIKVGSDCSGGPAGIPTNSAFISNSLMKYEIQPMRRLLRSLSHIFLTFAASGFLSSAIANDRPNIIYILSDDLGYGDVGCLNPDGRIPTPHMDRIAAEGMAFTDAHSGSSVCTPTRYSILTGRCNWRSRMKQGVLNGLSLRLIEENRQTVASFLKGNGYNTACIGKWHLGLNWSQNDGCEAGASDNPGKIDYTKAIEGGPTALGFDGFYGIRNGRSPRSFSTVFPNPHCLSWIGSLDVANI